MVCWEVSENNKRHRSIRLSILYVRKGVRVGGYIADQKHIGEEHMFESLIKLRLRQQTQLAQRDDTIRALQRNVSYIDQNP